MRRTRQPANIANILSKLPTHIRSGAVEMDWLSNRLGATCTAGSESAVWGAYGVVVDHLAPPLACTHHRQCRNLRRAGSPRARAGSQPAAAHRLPHARRAHPGPGRRPLHRARPHGRCARVPQARGRPVATPRRTTKKASF